METLFKSLFFACIFTSIAYVIIDGIIMKINKSKSIKLARQAGHEVVAKIVDRKYPIGETDPEYMNYVYGIYEYEYQGKKYKYKQKFIHTAPSELTLLFKKNPAKAKEETEFGGAESLYGKVFLISTILFYLLFSV